MRAAVDTLLLYRLSNGQVGHSFGHTSQYILLARQQYKCGPDGIASSPLDTASGKHAQRVVQLSLSKPKKIIAPRCMYTQQVELPGAERGDLGHMGDAVLLHSRTVHGVNAAVLERGGEAVEVLKAVRDVRGASHLARWGVARAGLRIAHCKVRALGGSFVGIRVITCFGLEMAIGVAHCKARPFLLIA